MIRRSGSKGRQLSLYEEAESGHVIREVSMFETTKDGYTWLCPFCASSAFTINVPPESDELGVQKTRRAIGQHLQHHRTDVLRNMRDEDREVYERHITSWGKQARIWIDGTVADHSKYYDSKDICCYL